MKTRFIIAIMIGMIVLGTMGYVYSQMYGCLHLPLWAKGPRFDLVDCWSLFVNDRLPD